MQITFPETNTIQLLPKRLKNIKSSIKVSLVARDLELIGASIFIYILCKDSSIIIFQKDIDSILKMCLTS